MIYLYCLFIPLVSGFLFASPGEIVPSNVNIKTGNTLDLNCSILSGYTNFPTFNSSNIFFRYVSASGSIKRIIDSQYYIIHGPKMLQLLYPNISMDESGYYQCCINETTNVVQLAATVVSVGDSPRPVSNVTAISYNFERLVVEWFPCEPIIYYTFQWHIDGQAYLNGIRVNGTACSYAFCSSRYQDICPANGTGCGDPGCFYRFLPYVINVTAMNIFGRSDFSETFLADESIVKPNQVTNLTVQSNATSLHLKWSLPFNQYLMSATFLVQFISEWDSIVKKQDAGTNAISVSLTKLTPYTRYEVSVSCKPVNGGYWSNPSSVIATTTESAPAVAPHVPSGWFRVEQCETPNNNSNCVITIFWKSIRIDLRHGIIVKYLMNVTMSDLYIQSFEITGSSDVYSGQIQFPFDSTASAYHFSLQAATQVGLSPPEFFVITVPDTDHLLLKDIVMETTADDSGVTIDWNIDENTSFDNFTLLYCVGEQYVVNQCYGEPVLVVIPSDKKSIVLSLNESGLVFALSANTHHSSTGLSQGWLCKFQYSALPAQPQLLDSAASTDSSIAVQWVPLGCDNLNKARVFGYILQLQNGSTDISTEYNIPANTSQFVIDGLMPNTWYNVSLLAVSRTGRGLAGQRVYQTRDRLMTNDKAGLIIGVSVGIVGVFIVIVLAANTKRFIANVKEKYLVDIRPPRSRALLQTGTVPDNGETSDADDEVSLRADVPQVISYTQLPTEPLEPTASSIASDVQAIDNTDGSIDSHYSTAAVRWEIETPLGSPQSIHLESPSSEVPSDMQAIDPVVDNTDGSIDSHYATAAVRLEIETPLGSPQSIYLESPSPEVQSDMQAIDPVVDNTDGSIDSHYATAAVRLEIETPLGSPQSIHSESPSPVVQSDMQAIDPVVDNTDGSIDSHYATAAFRLEIETPLGSPQSIHLESPSPEVPSDMQAIDPVVGNTDGSIDSYYATAAVRLEIETPLGSPQSIHSESPSPEVQSDMQAIDPVVDNTDGSIDSHYATAAFRLEIETPLGSPQSIHLESPSPEVQSDMQAIDPVVDNTDGSIDSHYATAAFRLEIETPLGSPQSIHLESPSPEVQSDMQAIDPVVDNTDGSIDSHYATAAVRLEIETPLGSPQSIHLESPSPEVPSDMQAIDPVVDNTDGSIDSYYATAAVRLEIETPLGSPQSIHLESPSPEGEYAPVVPSDNTVIGLSFDFANFDAEHNGPQVAGSHVNVNVNVNC